VKNAYEDGTERSKTSAYKIQIPGNHPEENTQLSEHGEILKSRKNEIILKSTRSIYYINVVFYFNFIVPPKKRLSQCVASI
jgi:hypothetical protein